MTYFDVAVVGAGPAGSTSASLLARLDHRVVLLDRAHFPRPKACAEYMSPGVGEVLRRLGLEELLAPARPLPVSGMEIVSPRGARLRIQYEQHGQRLYAATLPRHTFDSLLVAQAAAGGAELIEGFVAKQPLMGWGTVRGVVGTMNGRESAVQARLTVVADGSRSVLARALGLALTPRWPLRLGLVAHYAGPAALSDGFGQMHVAGDGYCGIAPLPDGLLNVNVVVKADAVRTSPYSAARFLEEWIAAHPRVSEVLRRCRRVTPVRGVGPIGARAGRAWAPGALLVGDAAGFFDPFTGEGIYRALRGAELVAQYGHLALDRDDFSGRILRPYDTARRRAFQWKQAVTVLVQLFVQYPGMMDYALPRLSVRTETAQTLSAVLGDVLDARQFMTPRMLWSALRP